MTTKQANPGMPPPPPGPVASNDALRGVAMNDILAVAGLAAAGGIGARGLLGLKYMFGRKRPDLGRALGPTVISVPAPVYDRPRDAARAAKMAGLSRLGELRAARLERRGRDEAAAATAMAVTSKAAEDLLTSRSQIPWYLPGVTMAGVGGMAGGYKLMDVLMDRKRKRDLEAEVGEARDNYRQALLSQYDPASVPSSAAVPDIAPPARTVNPQPGAAKPLALKAAGLQADLAALAEEAEKVAAEKAAMPGWAGKGLGIWGALASMLALGSGVASYNFTRDRSSNRLIERAVKDRERERWARRPPEIYAVPQPVHLTRAGDLSPAGTPPALPGT